MHKCKMHKSVQQCVHQQQNKPIHLFQCNSLPKAVQLALINLGRQKVPNHWGWDPTMDVGASGLQRPGMQDRLTAWEAGNQQLPWPVQMKQTWVVLPQSMMAPVKHDKPLQWEAIQYSPEQNIKANS